VKYGCNLAESSKEDYGSKKAALPKMTINVMYRDVNNMSQISSTQNGNKTEMSPYFKWLLHKKKVL
jgi:hypothetical protein